MSCVGPIAIECKGFYPWRDGIEGDDSTCAWRRRADDGYRNRKEMRIEKSEWRQPKPLPTKRAGGTSFRPSGQECEAVVVFEKASLMPSRGTELHGMILANKSHGSHMPSEFTSLYESVDSEFCENDFVQKSQLREGWGGPWRATDSPSTQDANGFERKNTSFQESQPCQWGWLPVFSFHGIMMSGLRSPCNALV